MIVKWCDILESAAISIKLKFMATGFEVTNRPMLGSIDWNYATNLAPIELVW